MSELHRRVSGESKLKCEVAGVSNIIDSHRAKLEKILSKDKNMAGTIQSIEADKFVATYYLHQSGEITVFEVHARPEAV